MNNGPLQVHKVAQLLEGRSFGFAGDAILDHLQCAAKFLAGHSQCVQEHLEDVPLAFLAQCAGATAPCPLPTRILAAGGTVES